MAKVSFGSGGSGGGFSGSFSTVLSASAGVQDGALFSVTVNQSGTAGYNGLRVNVTQNTVGSGAIQLFTVQNAGTARFHILPTGATVFAVGTECGRITPSTTTPKMLMQAAAVTGGQIGYQWGAINVGELAPASGIGTYISVRPDIQSSGTGGWTVLQLRANEGGTGTGIKRILECTSGLSTFVFAVRSNGQLEFATANTSTTIGAAGGASALPATPLGYVTCILESGTSVKIPYYNV